MDVKRESRRDIPSGDYARLSFCRCKEISIAHEFPTLEFGRSSTALPVNVVEHRSFGVVAGWNVPATIQLAIID